jgi:hypothetical protein
LLDQVGFFLAGTGGIAPSSALYVIVGGGNDARDAFEIAAGRGDPTVLISDYAGNIGSILTQLEMAGAAGGERAVEAAEELERCTEPLGTVGLTDTGDPFMPIVRMIVQQSNRFIVVERGRAYNNVDFERQLKQADLTRNAQAQKRPGGALLSADYTLVPSVTFAEPSGFALSTGLGGLFGRSSNKMDTSAQVQALGVSMPLLLLDNAGGAQIVAAQGSAKNYNLGAGVGVLGRPDCRRQRLCQHAAEQDRGGGVPGCLQQACARRPAKAQGAVGQGGRLKGP